MQNMLTYRTMESNQTKDTNLSCFASVASPSIQMRPLPTGFYTELKMLPACLTTELRDWYSHISPEGTNLCLRVLGTSSPGTPPVIFLSVRRLSTGTYGSWVCSQKDMRYKQKHET